MLSATTTPVRTESRSDACLMKLHRSPLVRAGLGLVVAATGPSGSARSVQACAFARRRRDIRSQWGPGATPRGLSGAERVQRRACSNPCGLRSARAGAPKTTCRRRAAARSSPSRSRPLLGWFPKTVRVRASKRDVLDCSPGGTVRGPKWWMIVADGTSCPWINSRSNPVRRDIDPGGDTSSASRGANAGWLGRARLGVSGLRCGSSQALRAYRNRARSGRQADHSASA
jgi:hypothetical protein